MNGHFTNKAGFALVGILAAVLIIAALAYGGLFFFRQDKSGAGQIKNQLDTLEKAKIDVNRINERTQAERKIMEETENQTGTSSAALPEN